MIDPLLSLCIAGSGRTFAAGDELVCEYQIDAVDPAVVMRMHVKQPAPRLDERIGAPWITPELSALVDGALVKEPENRFPRADVMIAALDDAFASLDRVL